LPAQTAIHTGELKEIEHHSSGKYANPYADVECWVDLKGPGFSKGIYGIERVISAPPGSGPIPTCPSGRPRVNDGG
jgi:hypothetical protein